MCAAFQRTAAAWADAPALRAAGQEGGFTWAQYAAEVERVAGGLAALGVRAGDTVALMLVNRPEFNIVDAAAMHLGAIPWSVYATSSPEQLTYLLRDAGSRVAITEERFAGRLAAADADGRLEHVISVEALDALPGPPAGFDFDAAWRAVAPEDPLTIIYTSGTTGAPKGVELSHAGMLACLDALGEVVRPTPGGRVVSYLPAAHVADRWSAHYWAMLLGAGSTCVAEASTVMGVLGEVRPTIFGSVPRVFEKLRAGLEAGFAAEPEPRRGRIRRALETGVACLELSERGEAIPPALAADRDAADAELFAPLRERLGLDQAEWLVVGAAPLAPETLRFFAAIGLPLSEVWGMSETCGLLTVNPPGDRRIGTVGPPLPGVELRLAADGEVLARAPQLMLGYRGRPELTAEALDADGWLHTGDVGVLEDGYLRIVDRKKELIINAAGKNMSPLAIEAALKTAGPLIGQACAVGDGRPYVVALLVLDPDGAGAWAADHGRDGAGLAELAADPRLLAAVEAEVDAANARLSRVEQLKRWVVLGGDWEPDGDELTPTMKLKRKPIAAKYAGLIDALYDEAATTAQAV